MRPDHVEVIGGELAIRWDDGTETYLPLERLRRECPCAACKGEMDALGNLHRGPESKLSPLSFQLVRIGNVGGYALQPYWKDGHATGLYPYTYLKKMVDR